MPTEPMAFGTSAEAIAELIPHLGGWSCLNVPAHLADDLIESVASAAGADSVLMRDDIYFVLRRPAPRSALPSARLITPADRGLVESASADLVGADIERLLATIEDGHVAGSIEDDRLVALAHTFATSPKHADIGVVTHPNWRRLGHATAVGMLVARAIQDDGRIPVWSCGGPNIGSLKTAARIGFQEVSRRVYLIPEFAETDDPSS